MQMLADRTQGDVQPNMDPAANSVEVANRAWDEGKSPYIKVATITIPRQGDIDSAGQMNACENLSFDPWRDRPETLTPGSRALSTAPTSEVRSRILH